MACCEAKVLRVNLLKCHVFGENSKIPYSKIQAQLTELTVPIVNQDFRARHESRIGEGMSESNRIVTFSMQGVYLIFLFTLGV